MNPVVSAFVCDDTYAKADTVPSIENGDFEENLKAMDTAVMNINSLLRKRIELVIGCSSEHALTP